MSNQIADRDVRSAKAGTPKRQARNPVVVALLTLLTFGVYGLYWAWKLTAQVDAEIDDGPSAYPLVKWGVGLFLALPVGFLVALPLLSAGLEPPPSVLALVIGGGFLLSIIGYVVTIVGLYRAWSKIRMEERAQESREQLLRPGWYVVGILVLGPVLGMAVVGYLTQARWNELGEQAAT